MAEAATSDQRIHDILRVLRRVHADLKRRGLGGGNPIDAHAKAYRDAIAREFSDLEFELPVDEHSRSACDMFDPVTGTVMEFAGSLPNATREFEKDLLKAAVLAERTGKVNALIFLTDDKGVAKATSALRRVLAGYIQRKAAISVRVASLESELEVDLASGSDAKRQFGQFQGRVKISDDFDELPEDFLGHFTVEPRDNGAD